MAILYVMVAAALLGLAYVTMRVPREHRSTTWGRLAALTLRLIGLMLVCSFYAVVGILFVMNRRLHSEEQLGLCIDIGLLIGILCGAIAHVALLHRARRLSSKTDAPN